MDAVIVFFRENSALLVAIIALILSLRANWIADKAHKLNVAINDAANRRVFAEKHRELLNELDVQDTKLATLALVTAQKMLLFKENPILRESHEQDFLRLQSNLKVVETMRSNYTRDRQNAEKMSIASTDAAGVDAILSKMRQLTIHVDKDVRHEEADLEVLRSKV